MSDFNIQPIDLIVIVLMTATFATLNETGHIGYVQELILVPVLGTYFLGRDAERLQAKIDAWRRGSAAEAASE
jgi:hypothetical protein